MKLSVLPRFLLSYTSYKKVKTFKFFSGIFLKYHTFCFERSYLKGHTMMDCKSNSNIIKANSHIDVNENIKLCPSKDFHMDDSNLRSKSLENIPADSNNTVIKLYKHNYDHVESKVKIYISELKRREQERKRLQEERNKLQCESPSTSCKDYAEEPFEDIKQQLELYKSMYRDELVANSSKQITIDNMKSERDHLLIKLKKLETKMEALESSKTGTPLSIRSWRQNFKTPIPSLSRTLLNPFRSTNKTTNLDDESLSDLSVNNSGYDKKSLDTPSEGRLREFSFTSEEPLMGNRFSWAGKFMRSWFSCNCLSINRLSSQNGNVPNTKHYFKNKVYPSVVRDNEINNVCDVPLIFIIPAPK